MSLKQLVPIAALLTMVTAVAGPAGAQNLIVNPDFASELTVPWLTSGLGLSGTWSFDAVVGNLAPGSAACTDNNDCTIAQCIDVSALPHPITMELAGFVSHGGQLATVSRFVSANTNNTVCSGFGLGIVFTETFGPPTAFTEYSSTFETVAGTQSLYISFSMTPAFDGGPIAVHLDDVRLVADQAVIHGDGFESGDTSQWSSSAGE